MKQIARLQGEILLSDDLVLGSAVHGIAPFDAATHLRWLRQHRGEPLVHGRKGVRTRTACNGHWRDRCRVELHAYSMRQRDSASRRADEFRIRREAPLGVGIERRTDGVEISEDGLMYALGKREIRERVMRFEEPIHFGIDGRAFSG
jgi:hypothetical protein